jgi:hypothetical protein
MGLRPRNKIATFVDLKQWSPVEGGLLRTSLNFLQLLASFHLNGYGWSYEKFSDPHSVAATSLSQPRQRPTAKLDRCASPAPRYIGWSPFSGHLKQAPNRIRSNANAQRSLDEIPRFPDYRSA